MSFGNGELPYPDKPVHLAGVFVAEQRRGLAVAFRKVAVRLHTVFEYFVLERTGHGTQRKHFAFRVGIAENEHTVAIMIPVTAYLIKLALCHIRGFREQISAFRLGVFDKTAENLEQFRALGHKQRQPLSDRVAGHKISEFAPDFVVVALFGFFDSRKIGFHIGFFVKRRAVNP